MAIFPFVPGIAASIICNGSVLEELQDPHDIQVDHEDPEIKEHQQLRTVSRYIESIEDAFFSIKLNVTPQYKMMDVAKLGFHIKVDGNEVKPEPICARPVLKRQKGRWEGVVSGVREGIIKRVMTCDLKKFKFSKITTSMFSLFFLSISSH